MIYYNPKLKEYSRELRKRITDSERQLWSRLRRKQLKGLQFYRQRIIGNYIVDFYCPKARVIIEVDGGQHYSEEEKEEDTRRDDYMARRGLKVLRFSDREVLKNLDAVVEQIYNSL